MLGFWIFMLIVDLIVPLTMIVFGELFMVKTPKNINVLFGYRTTLSMKNMVTWKFAHKYCGKLMFWIGIIILPLSVIPLIFVIDKKINTIAIVGIVICIIQIITLIIPIFATQIALKKTFDQDGNRKK